MYLLVFHLLDILCCELDNPSDFPSSRNYQLGGSESKISLHKMDTAVKHLVPCLHAW